MVQPLAWALLREKPHVQAGSRAAPDLEEVRSVDAIGIELDQTFRTGASLDFEGRLVMADGSCNPVPVGTDSRRDNSGNLELAGAVQDVTERRTFEEIRALHDRLFEENVALREEIDQSSMLEDIVGNSPPLRAHRSCAGGEWREGCGALWRRCEAGSAGNDALLQDTEPRDRQAPIQGTLT